MNSSSSNHLSLDLNLDLSINKSSVNHPETLDIESKDEADGEFQSNEKAEVLKAELSRVTMENKKLNILLEAITCDYTNLWKKMLDLTMVSSSEKDQSPSLSPTTKRKSKMIECMSNKEDSCEHIKEDRRAKVWKVEVRTDAYDSSLVLRDGYQWRKYGQKMTKDNGNPRAYFKCSLAPSCSIKKKVQRSMEDTTILVATYQGQHNHSPPFQLNNNNNNNNSDNNATVVFDCKALELSQDEGPLIRPKRNNLVEQMTQTLSKDPSFTAALATVISSRIMQLPSSTTK